MATSVGLLERDARELNRGFVKRMTLGLPWVTVKIGASVDGRTALADGSSQWITSGEARADVQRLRARACAIVTGIGTALTDNPSLTVRDATLDLHGREPLRVVLDAKGSLPVAANLASDGRATLVFTSQAGLVALQALAAAAQPGLRVESLHVDVAGRIDLTAALRRLAELECNEVLVEAGSRVAGSFIASRLADEVVVYVAPTILGETALPAFTLPHPLGALAARSRFNFHDVRRVGPDLRVTLRPLES
jgi:diaminohydroxyphosphoribosylaminopyrimidine deaminase/5-amino-6-(5-phosphoribosylamino)uracil reductase